MKPRVVVLGATGQVGLFTVFGLLQAGRTVIAVTRNDEAGARQMPRGLGRCDSAGLRGILGEAQPGEPFVLLSCGPADLALQTLHSLPRDWQGRWERTVVVGSTSTIVKSKSGVAAERDMVRDIERALAAIRQHCGAKRIPLTILSPTLIYGCGMDQNLTRVWRWVGRFRIAPLAWRPTGLRQPLHVADLGAAIVNAVEGDPAIDLESPIAGGSTLDYREMIGRLFDAAGYKRRFLRLPDAAFPVVAGLARLVPGVAGINSEMLKRQSRDQVFDDREARSRLAHQPRHFQPSPGDFELPPHIEEIRKSLI